MKEGGNGFCIEDALLLAVVFGFSVGEPLPKGANDCPEMINQVGIRLRSISMMVALRRGTNYYPF